MSELGEFVLGYYRAQGALVEEPAYGVHEVLLPDALATELEAPALQEIIFDQPAPEGDDGHLYLSAGHPLLDRIIARARQTAAPTQSFINNVRLDKRGLAEAARQVLSFPNARLVALPNEHEKAALCHYLVFTYKVTLASDEKQERIATIALDAQAGWPVDWGVIQAMATLNEQGDFAHLVPAPPRWIEAAHPLAPSALTGLAERAQAGVLTQLAEPIEAISRRAARHLELDQARLEQYYTDLERDLRRRLEGALVLGERRAATEDKLAALQLERQMKLADARERYHLHADLELVTVQVVVQPKILLRVQIENRSTTIQRTIVWNPLLHHIEPLACDVCGQPGTSLQLCSGGHLAHVGCLLEAQCVDCKRVYCRLCAEQMSSCVVCGRPVCASSLNHCPVCGRGTCHEHTGLCHAANGAPQMLTVTPAAAPVPAEQPRHKARPAPTPTPQRPAAPTKLRSTPPAPRRPAGDAVHYHLAVETEWSVPEVRAYVLYTKKRGPAVRTWRLSPQGICVSCDCEKGAACPIHGLLLRPAEAGQIEAQIGAQIEQLRQEYGVPARNVSYTLFMHGAPHERSAPHAAGRVEERTDAGPRTGWF